MSMMSRADHKTYDLIACEVGRRLGMPIPDARTCSRASAIKLTRWTVLVADDVQARTMRDELYVEFEARLRDPAYTLHELQDWFGSIYGPVAVSSIHRVRVHLLAEETRIAETGAQARAFMELARASGADAVFGGAVERAGQLLFELLFQTRAEDLSSTGREAANFAKLLGALGSLMRGRAETDLARARLDEMRRRLAEAKAAADRRAESELRAGGVGPEMIARIREIYGLPVESLPVEEAAA